MDDNVEEALFNNSFVNNIPPRFSIIGRICPQNFFKNIIEMREIVKTAIITNFRNISWAIHEQSTSIGNANIIEQFNKSLVGFCFYVPTECRCIHIG